jgi:hypothetical protein
MTKVDKLRLCGWLLVVATALILASSIQLEVTGGCCNLFVWLHVILGCLFFAAILLHLYLHFNWKSWIGRLWKRTPMMRWLTISALLTLISGFIALFHWIGEHMHSPLGAVHGKIGFVFLAIVIWHTAKRIKFLVKR